MCGVRNAFCPLTAYKKKVVVEDKNYDKAPQMYSILYTYYATLSQRMQV